MRLSLGCLLGSLGGHNMANQAASPATSTERKLGAVLLWFESIL